MDEARTIPLRRRDGSVWACALVDAADYEAVSQYRWQGWVDRSGRIRVQGRQGGRKVQLSRQLLGLSPGDPLVDHKNGDPLDNRRSNLRLATSTQNLQNRQGATRRSKSGVRGAHWDGATGRWRAQVKVDGKQYRLGRFDTIEEAGVVAAAFRRERMAFSEMDH